LPLAGAVLIFLAIGYFAITAPLQQSYNPHQIRAYHLLP